MASAQLCSRFSITQAKSLVKDLSVPNPKIYWADFLVSIIVGHACFSMCLNAPKLFSLPQTEMWLARGLLFAITAILYMRSAMFIHELVHLRSGTFRGFRIAWNLLCGIPFMTPSFLYYPHIDHHRRKSYGTDHDGEYLDLSHRHPANLLLFVGAALVVPVAAFARFLIMAPISWFIPSFQKWVEKHASSMVIDLFYLRGDFGPEARRVMRIQEFLCFLCCVGMVLRAPIASGTWIDEFLIQGYLISVTLILINNVRTLGAHRWTGDGSEMSFEEQLLDSVNYPHRRGSLNCGGRSELATTLCTTCFQASPTTTWGSPIVGWRLASQLTRCTTKRRASRCSVRFLSSSSAATIATMARLRPRRSNRLVGPHSFFWPLRCL